MVLTQAVDLIGEFKWWRRRAQMTPGSEGWRSSTAEQLICNQQVVGSSPIASSMQKNCLGGDTITKQRSLVGSAGQGIVRCLTRRGEVPEWPKGADCKSAGDAFEGSNPSLSTNLVVRE